MPFIPHTGLTGLKEHWKADLMSGFLVFLIALPLCLGISMASHFPPVAGIITAMVGGLFVTFFTNSQLTIKGPAAGLIVLAVGAVEELGMGNDISGYKLALATIVISGVIQVIFGLLRPGALGDFFPSAAVHGMLAAIGIAIASRQFHTLLGVKMQGKDAIDAILEIPSSIMHFNPEITVIGVISLVILFGLPMVKNNYVKMIPAPMIVLLVAIPLGFCFDLEHAHTYLLNHTEYELGPRFLLTLPTHPAASFTFPDFSQVFSLTSIKYIIMFALVGSFETLLSTKAVDLLDPYKRKSDLNKDLLAVGAGNTLSGLLGGLPMISEIVRSEANKNNGAKTNWSNFFHGLFLLVFVAFAPDLIHHIPLAALAAMLIYTGYRLASPREFYRTYIIGKEQLLIFIVTIVATLLTDLLIGIAIGILTKFMVHFVNGLSLKSLFKPIITINTTDEETFTVEVKHSAVFSNFIGLKKQLEDIPKGKTLIIDFTDAALVDHTVMAHLHELREEYEAGGGSFHIAGLEQHTAFSSHPYASRKKTIHNKPL